LKILVTGATGYIGNYFIRMMQNDASITALLRRESNEESLISFSCSTLRFNSYEEIPLIMELNKFDGVMHFASHISDSSGDENIGTLIDSNILYSTYLLEGASKSGVSWFINTGTFWQNYNSSIYCPVNLYAATKESFQCISKYYTETSEMLFATIKLNDTFGPHDKRKKLLSYIINSNQSSGDIIQLTDGEQIIDASFIEDIISAYWQLIIELNKDHSLSGKTFYVSNSEKYTLKETIGLLESVTCKKFNINWGGKE
jgi:CDP-paratose synthetase